MSRPTDNRTVTDWSETEEINTENDATSSRKGKNERSLLFEATLFVWNFPEVRVSARFWRAKRKSRRKIDRVVKEERRDLLYQVQDWKEVVSSNTGIRIKCEKVGPAYRYLCNSTDGRISKLMRQNTTVYTF